MAGMLAPALPVLPMLHVGASISWTSFTVHWSTVIGLGAMAVLYEWRMRVHGGEPGRRLYFYSALATIFLSLNGWLHDLSDWYLFSAHMVQHLLLTILMPPLLLVGVPGWMLRPALQLRPIGVIARWMTRPKVCFAAFQ